MYSDSKDRGFFLNHFIWIISVVPRETTLSISDFTGEPVSIESETVRVVSHGTTEISEIKRLKVQSLRSKYLKNPKQIRPYLELKMTTTIGRVRIPLQVIRKLHCSMRRRCLAVLGANGRHTRY